MAIAAMNEIDMEFYENKCSQLFKMLKDLRALYELLRAVVIYQDIDLNYLFHQNFLLHLVPA